MAFNQQTAHTSAGSNWNILRQTSQSRKLCIRPRAAASPDIKADDTAEARRRLSRQFRRHKLEPQPVVSTPAGAAANPTARLRLQGLRPRPLLQQQDLHDPQQLPAEAPSSVLFGQQLPSAAAAASAASSAAARELLERQFRLGHDAGSAGDPHAASQFQLDAGSTSVSSSSSHGDALEAARQMLGGLSTDSTADPGKELTKAIMRAEHWRQVQSLIQEHGPEALGPVHLCAALTRLVRLQPTFTISVNGSDSDNSGSSSRQELQQQQGAAVNPQATHFIQQLCCSIGEIRPVLQYRQACNVLWAVSKLQATAQPSADWLAAMYEHACSCRDSEQPMQQDPVDQQQHQAHALRHAAQLAYSLVSLQQHLPEQKVQQLVAWLTNTTRDILQQHIQGHEPSGEPRQQQQQQQPHQQQLQLPQHQQETVADRQQVRQQKLGARDMSTLAWSLAYLDAQPGPAWLSAYASALSCRGLMSAGNCRDISTLLWATATFSKSAEEGSAAANSLHAAAAALLAAAQDTGLARCDGQALANTLWGLATLGVRPPVPWLNKLLQHVEKTASRGVLCSQGISVTLWSLAALGVVPQASCMAALQLAVQQQLQQMTPQALGNVLWALAVLEQPPSKAWLAGFWPRCRVLLPDMTSQGLINCLWAAARLGLQPPQEWVGDMAALLLQQQGLQSLSSQGISNVVWAMSRINVGCRAGKQLLAASLQRAVGMLQQQLQTVAADVSGTAAAFNIYELSGLMNAVCQLRMHAAAQHQGMASFSGGPPSNYSSMDDYGAIAASSAAEPYLLSQLKVLLQEASLPLLATAAPSEMSMLLWSQIAMPAGISSSVTQQGVTPASVAAAGGFDSQPSGMPMLDAVTAADAAGHAAGPAPQSSTTTSSASREGPLAIPKSWMDAWMAGTQQAFNAASSRDLATWLWCLAKRSHRPTNEWLASWQVASFRQMRRASSQDLSNMLWSLAQLGITPDPAWLQQHLRGITRRQLQKQLLPQHYANISWALAKMGHRPDRDWSLKFQEDVFSLMRDFKPQELANVLWAMAHLNMKVAEELLDESKAFMAAHMSAYKAYEVAVSLWALDRLKGQPELRLMAMALQHCFSQARQLTPNGWSMLMWSVGNMSTAPPKAWVSKLLVATQVRMSGFSAQELSMLAVSLARLEYRPPDAWLDCLAAAAAAKFANFEAQALANTLWALATLHYTPSEAWMTAFDGQLARHLASFTPAHVAMTMWAMSRLQWLPAQPLWQQLQERAELHSASYCLRSQRMLQRAVRVLEKVESEDEEEH